MAKKKRNRKNSSSYLVDFDGSLTSNSVNANKTNERVQSLKEYAYRNREQFPNANKKLNGDTNPSVNKGK